MRREFGERMPLPSAEEDGKMRLGARIWGGAVMVGAMAALAACDKGTKMDEIVQTSAMHTSDASTAPPKPVGPKPPNISVDDNGCLVDGEEVLFAAADAKGRIAAVLAGKPLVGGEAVLFDAPRDVKTPKVAAVVAALRVAKAKVAIARTPTRDKVLGQLELLLQHGPISDCSAIGMVNKDGSIAVWPTGGGTARRFVRGLAGPDLTLGPQAIQQLAGGCDASTWLVASDDNVPWGLTFDLAIATHGSADAGTSIRASQTLLITEPPVPGRKVTPD